MKSSRHVIISAGISVLVYFYFKSLACAFISFFAGVLIDLDHLFDFCVGRGIKRYKDFFKIVHATHLKKLYLFFHSYELIIILWVLGLSIRPVNIYLVSAAIGLTQHMILDQIANPITFKGYFFIYRLLHGFDTEKIVRKDFLERQREIKRYSVNG